MFQRVVRITCQSPLRRSRPVCRGFSATSPAFSVKTHFGFRDVDESEKSSLVANVFHNVASNYDLMNDLMSGTIHRLWKDEFVNMLHPVPGTNLLDVAGGTGDVAFRFLEAVKASPWFVPGANRRTSVQVCDINPSMIEIGKARASEKKYDQSEDPTISWLVGDAEQLPLPSDTFDAYTIAFGIRNCTHIDRVLREAHRVLRRGGRFMCLEFSHIDTSQALPSFLPASQLDDVLQAVYDAYSFSVIPQLGKAVANDEESYRYLVESIRRFPRQPEFAAMIQEAGFSNVKYTNLTFGVVAVHSGFKL